MAEEELTPETKLLTDFAGGFKTNDLNRVIRGGKVEFRVPNVPYGTPDISSVPQSAVAEVPADNITARPSTAASTKTGYTPIITEPVPTPTAEQSVRAAELVKESPLGTIASPEQTTKPIAKETRGNVPDDVRSDLKSKGLSDTQINRMRPEDAQAHAEATEKQRTEVKATRADATVKSRLSDLSDNNLRKASRTVGIDPNDYDFNVRDANRHRVERDQLAKEVTEQMHPEELMRHADNAERMDKEGMWDNKDMAGKSKAERSAAIFKDRLGSSPLDAYGNPRTGGGAPDESYGSPARVEAARKRAMDKSSRMSAGFDPTIAADYAEVAYGYLKSGITTFAEFSSQMTDKFGKTVRPYLTGLWEDAKSVWKNSSFDHEAYPDAAKSAREFIDKSYDSSKSAEHNFKEFAAQMEGKEGKNIGPQLHKLWNESIHEYNEETETNPVQKASDKEAALAAKRNSTFGRNVRKATRTAKALAEAQEALKDYPSQRKAYNSALDEYTAALHAKEATAAYKNMSKAAREVNEAYREHGFNSKQMLAAEERFRVANSAVEQTPEALKYAKADAKLKQIDEAIKTVKEEKQRAAEEQRVKKSETKTAIKASTGLPPEEYNTRSARDAAVLKRTPLAPINLPVKDVGLSANAQYTNEASQPVSVSAKRVPTERFLPGAKSEIKQPVFASDVTTVNPEVKAAQDEVARLQGKLREAQSINPKTGRYDMAGPITIERIKAQLAKAQGKLSNLLRPPVSGGSQGAGLGKISSDYLSNLKSKGIGGPKVERIVNADPEAGQLIESVEQEARHFGTTLASQPPVTSRPQDGLGTINLGEQSRTAPAASSANAKLNNEELLKQGWTQAAIDNGKHLPTVGGGSDANSPTFYSKAERIANNKVSTGSGDSILSTLRNNGVKESEIKWMGLDDFLKGKPKVSKADVQQFIANNKIELKDVDLGGKRTEDLLQLTKERDKAFVENNKIWADHLRYAPHSTELFNAMSGGDPESVIQQMPEKLQEPARRFVFTDSLIHNYDKALAESHKNAPPSPKYSKWTLPGEKTNYTEKLLTLPDKSKEMINKLNDRLTEMANRPSSEHNLHPEWKDEWDQIHKERNALISKPEFRGTHFEEPNILAHVRYDERPTTDGNKALVIEELQSDWHQKGKRDGYKSTEPPANAENKGGYFEVTDKDGKFITNVYDTVARTTEAAIAEAARRLRENPQSTAGGQRVPDAPFKSDWHELAMKRMLREAAEKGYNQLAWTTGEQQADRYDLSKRISVVEWHPGHENPDEGKLFAGDMNGNPVMHDWMHKDQIADYIGKDAAQKLLNSPIQQSETGRRQWKSIHGLDLKVGGEWAKALYDRAIPNFLNKYAKKWGAKVGTSEIPVGTDTDRIFVGRQPSQTEINEVWRTSHGTLHTSVNNVVSGMQEGMSFDKAMDHYGTEELADAFKGKMQMKPRTVKVHSITITPAMKKSVLQEGQPISKGIKPIILPDATQGLGRVS